MVISNTQAPSSLEATFWGKDPFRGSAENEPV